MEFLLLCDHEMKLMAGRIVCQFKLSTCYCGNLPILHPPKKKTPQHALLIVFLISVLIAICVGLNVRNQENNIEILTLYTISLYIYYWLCYGHFIYHNHKPFVHSCHWRPPCTFLSLLQHGEVTVTERINIYFASLSVGFSHKPIIVWNSSVTAYKFPIRLN